ncbi:hypothetical protein PGB34_06165 [Xenophilus arseniciresistens]|uniref:Uncharacterized protein n=1 Tax=Xenophilus arseniciresistens TaxID=1283306 RepID=A0AAE3N5I3_9BURK|nr:hypothetical protein [Xenophilus arseniciresistens]MDA7415945.1 hypothetical protein [Xenophilus arseniciresistens]
MADSSANREGFELNDKLVFDLQLALYLDLVAVLERTGVVSYRQMAARVLNISLNAREDGDNRLADVLEGIASGFSRQEGGVSVELLKVAGDLRDDEALGDIPSRPEGL